jgi:hypothetical protein
MRVRVNPNIVSVSEALSIRLEELKRNDNLSLVGGKREVLGLCANQEALTWYLALPSSQRSPP